MHPNHVVNFDQPEILASAKIWQGLNLLSSLVTQDNRHWLQSRHQLYAIVTFKLFDSDTLNFMLLRQLLQWSLVIFCQLFSAIEHTLLRNQWCIASHSRLIRYSLTMQTAGFRNDRNVFI